MEAKPKKSRAKWWIVFFLLVCFVIPLVARIELLTH